mmetsp:Transcript_30718/g.42963  ORF Transcript_30718/g.42963 Transcript_30718/m.42963 type:complete len:614 (-) Transcript_30718:235-2076(-)
MEEYRLVDSNKRRSWAKYSLTPLMVATAVLGLTAVLFSVSYPTSHLDGGSANGIDLGHAVSANARFQAAARMVPPPAAAASMMRFRSPSVKGFSNMAEYSAGVQLDASLIKADLPYNAKKEGFTAALERAVRNRDLAAVRVLEQARTEVMEKSQAGGSMGKWDEIREKQALERRKKLMDLSIKRRSNEDKLVAELKAQGDFSLESKDQYGLTVDVRKIISQQAETLEKALRDGGDDGGDGTRLVSMRTEIDAMPWWEQMPEYMMELRVAQTLRERLGLNQVAVLMDDPSRLTREPTEGLKIGRLDSPQDAAGCDIVIALRPDCSSVANMERVIKASHGTNYGDVIVMGGNYGSPSDPEAKQVRQMCKDLFTAGLQAISFVMPPVKLVPNVGGEPYPLPQWLIDAGYKATGNVAITGNSGTGKSSLNNALRGLRPRDDGAAAVGVKETTLDPHGYDFEPAGKDMKVWDLPGAGTPKFPLDSYMRTMGIKYFDEVIIASASRFTETDLELMDELRMHGIPFIALRTKVDLEIRNAQKDSGSNEQETLNRIREDIKKNSLLPDERVFMVSARRPEEFDFQRLRQYIVDSLHRGVDVKLAKALNRKLDVQEIWNTVC